MYRFRKDLEAKKAVEINVPHKKVMMCLNESTLNPLEAVKDQLLENLKLVPLNRYFNDITPKLKNKLAEYVGHGIKPSQILFGNGADEMLYYIFTSVRESVRSYAVSLAPSYFDYKSYCDAVGLGFEPIELNKDFNFSVEDYLEKLNHPNCKLGILCNPNNPTGNLIPDKKIVHILENTDKLVLLDETYFEFSGITFADVLHKYPNLVIVRSFSKAFSVAGLRFGYLITSEENAIEIGKVMTAFHSSLMIQTFAYTILENKEIFLTHTEKVKDIRNKLYLWMLSQDYITVYPSHTNFLIFTIGDSTPELFDYLSDNEVALRPVWGHPLLKNHIRISIGTQEEIEKFMQLFLKFIDRF
ncbi:histidinol-phosphate aminotransferase family protein [bacterium]|nr:histidinol-phosphate aminotransferase family protein [bacterium]